jgi:excisionase family DNA binding protein
MMCDEHNEEVQMLSRRVDQENSNWLTTDEAAQYLKVKKRTLLMWTRQGKVPAFALSGTKRRVWRYRREELDQALLRASVLKSPSLSVHSQEKEVS